MGKLEMWRDAAKCALDAQDELLGAWTLQDMRAFTSSATQEDIEMLRLLIHRRIYPINAFDALVQIDQSLSIDVLLSNYLGDRVEPDRRFGGYYFELSAMLDDLKETHGESALCSLLGNFRLRRDLLADRRVIDAFTEALDLSPEQFQKWLSKQ